MVVLAAYNGVEIRSSPDVVGGEPRLGGTRLKVQLIAQKARERSVSWVLEAYPWIEHQEVEAAVQYAEDHPREMAYLARVRHRHERYLAARKFVCGCGEAFATNEGLRTHVDNSGGEDVGHYFEESVFEGTLWCSCGEQFESFGEFVQHEKQGGEWSRFGHILEEVTDE